MILFPPPYTSQSQQMSHEELFLEVLFGVISLWFCMENCYLRGRKTSSVNSLARNTNNEYCKDHAGQWVAPVLFHPLSGSAEQSPTENLRQQHNNQFDY